ncbi:MAG: DsbA family protein [SAR324 cluster bacterium]|nr:DsbA family protein [SAR324 cluster bacterium]
MSTGRIQKLKENYNVDLQWSYFPLHPETPQEGRSLKDLFGSSDADIAAKNERMKNLMEEEGLPYGKRSMTYNSRLAQELSKWSDSQPDGQRIHAGLYRAYFVEGKNIGEIEELLHITEKAELPVEEAREVLEKRRLREAVDLDWGKARQMGVTGVPTFAAGQYMVVGAQPYDVLEQLVQSAQKNS